MFVVPGFDTNFFFSSFVKPGTRSCYCNSKGPRNLLILIVNAVKQFFAVEGCGCKCGCVQTNGCDTNSGQTATQVHHNVAGHADDDDDGEVRIDVPVANYTRGGQFGAGEVRFGVAGDDDGRTIRRRNIYGPTSLGATMPFVLN